MTQAIVLSSGGLDSTTALSLAVDRYTSPCVWALSISYGQRHSKEVSHASAISRYFGVLHSVITLPESIFSGGERSGVLVADGKMPDMTYTSLRQSGPLSTFVPNRNAVFASVAVAVAFAHGIDEVWLGVHSDDSRDWAYPDCSPEFVGAMSAATYVGTYQKVRLVTPFLWMTKAEIVRAGLAKYVPYSLTWTCYEGDALACGVCPACLERRAAFAANGQTDPIAYKEIKK